MALSYDFPPIFGFPPSKVVGISRFCDDQLVTSNAVCVCVAHHP